MPSKTSTGLSGDTIDHSPRRLSRLRLRDRINASTSSLASNNSSGGNDDPGSGEPARPESSGGVGGGVRASMDKLKDRVSRRSSDGRRGSNDSSSAAGAGGNRLSALVHSRSRRKSKQIEDANMVSRALSAHSTGSGEGLGLSGNVSESSLVAGSDQSSLLTDGYSDSERYVVLSFCLLRVACLLWCCAGLERLGRVHRNGICDIRGTTKRRTPIRMHSITEPIARPA